MTRLTFSFLLALGLMVAVRLWLSVRQTRAVGAGAGAVPGPFAHLIEVADHAKACQYVQDKLALGRLELLVDAVVLWALTLGGGLNALDTLFASPPWSPLLGGVMVLASLMLLMSLIGLPFSLWTTFKIEAHYGFNRQTPGLYVADLIRALLLSALLGLPLISLVLWLMASAGDWWWLYAWGVWVAFGLILSAAYPRYLAPLFNKFEPLPSGDLRTRLEHLVASCGFNAEGLYVMDGSKRSSHGNAYFTGVGRTKRIVLFDTLVERLEAGELEAVLAHELGHFRLNHVRTRLLTGFATSLAGFAALGWLGHQTAFYQGLGVTVPSNHAALALFTLVLPVYLFALGPLSAWWSRRDEYAADRYAATHADGKALASALVKLYRDNASTLTPDPLYSAWHDSHPAALARINALARMNG